MRRNSPATIAASTPKVSAGPLDSALRMGERRSRAVISVSAVESTIRTSRVGQDLPFDLEVRNGELSEDRAKNLEVSNSLQRHIG